MQVIVLFSSAVHLVLRGLHVTGSSMMCDSKQTIKESSIHHTDGTCHIPLYVNSISLL